MMQNSGRTHPRAVNRGFTLVELVIVIAVIAILAAVLVPTFSGVVKKAHASAALIDATNAALALSEELTVPEDTTDLLIFSCKGGDLYVFGYHHSTRTVQQYVNSPIKRNNDTFEAQVEMILAELSLETNGYIAKDSTIPADSWRTPENVKPLLAANGVTADDLIVHADYSITNSSVFGS